MEPGTSRASRLLLVFAPSASEARYGEQCRLLEGYEAGLEDRDLLFIPVFEGERETAAPRERYGVSEGRFEAVLLGRDGGEKFRSAEPVTPEELFERIDAMPMRRRES